MRSRDGTWRFIDTGTRSGVENMAVDEAILYAHANGLVPPTIHFYEWEPCAVSIGRFQQCEAAVHTARCRVEGIDVVRRPTGGRAVLHRGDFTFSIVATAREHIPPTVKGSYAVMSRVVSSALAGLGLSRATLTRGREVGKRQSCFSSSTPADVVVGGRKLVGSAQVWEGHVFLQQNSILFEADVGETLRFVRPGPGQSLHEAIRELKAKTCQVVELLGRRPDREELTDALARALCEVLEVDVLPGELTSVEIENALKFGRAAGGASTGRVQASVPADGRA